MDELSGHTVDLAEVLGQLACGASSRHAAAAAMAGARAIAGDEEAGTPELLLAHPVSRTRLVLQRFGAVAATVCWLGLVLLALGFGAAALAAGALTGNRGLVLGVTATLAVGAYLAYTVGGQIASIRSVRKLSPFWYYLGNDPLRSGLDAGGLTVLVVIPLVLLAAALWALNRRDIAT